MTEELENTQGGVQRRTVVKGAAWSVPVIAAAVSVPMTAATPTFDVNVESERCNIVGLTNPPYFTIEAQTGTIPAGSVFDLTVNQGLLGVGIFNNSPQDGYSWVDLGLFEGVKTYRITTDRDITPSTPLTVQYLPSSGLAAFINSVARLDYVSSPSGVEGGPGSNGQRQSVSYAQVAGVYLFSCSD